jgi:hypothetical protein
MKTIKVFSVTKNEYDLIEDFILYHGYLFGYENIVLIDNESTDASVLEIYEKYKKKGVIVYTEESYVGENQGILFTKYMNQYKNECDFMIGLDTDEFVFNIDAINNGEDPTNRDKILEIFENLPSNFTSFSIGSYPCGIVDTNSPAFVDQKIINPARNITTFNSSLPIEIIQKNPGQGTIPKCISRSNAFVKTVNGNHVLIVSHGDHLVLPIGYFHFATTGNRRVYERAKIVVKGYNYLDVDNLCYKDQINIMSANINRYSHGCHKVGIYKNFLLRRIVIEYFIKYHKRLPKVQEVDKYFSVAWSKQNTSEIEVFMKASNPDAFLQDVDIPNISQNEIDDLLFYAQSYTQPKNNNSHSFECFSIKDRFDLL